MLVLSRKVGEKLIIDGRIEVTITQVDGEKVRIGLTVPADVRVDREEAYCRRRAECTKMEIVGCQ